MLVEVVGARDGRRRGQDTADETEQADQRSARIEHKVHRGFALGRVRTFGRLEDWLASSRWRDGAGVSVVTVPARFVVCGIAVSRSLHSRSLIVRGVSSRLVSARVGKGSRR